MASIYIETINSDWDYLNGELLKSFFSGLSMGELLALTQVTRTLTGLAETELGGRKELMPFTESIGASYDGTATLRVELNNMGSMNPQRDASINFSLTSRTTATGGGLGQLSSTTPCKDLRRI